MPGLEMLDVAIGIIFIFLMLSLICSAIHELIEAWLKLRAVDLERGIRELLQDPENTKNLVQELYSHPLIFSLFTGIYDPKKIRKNNRYERNSNLPAYIPTRNFALALMDIVLPATDKNQSGAKYATTNETSTNIDEVPLDNSSPPSTVAPLAGKSINSFQRLREAIGSMPNSNIQRALRTLIDAAGGDVDKARDNIENWFNSSMDRVSGWYKRRTQKIIFFIGLMAAIAVNADTITIFNSLVNDPPLRNSLLAAAQQYAAQPQILGDTLTKPEIRIKNNLAEIEKHSLPMGWNSKNAAAIPIFNPEAVGHSIGLWLVKLIGWFITAVAITLGAPFWFDLLNKFMVIRSTVKPHEKSQEEASEDR